MSISLSQASIDVIVQTISGLTATIDKAIAHGAAAKYDQQAYLTARFFPDMYPFDKQVRMVARWAESIPAMLAGVSADKPADDEKSLEDLKARLERALAYAQSIDRAVIDAAADEVLTFPAGAGTRRMTGRDFVLHYSLPHLFFHATTAYDLLRHSGVPLAKRDFMGQVQGIIEG
jgi:hypothetical protein